MSTDLQSNPLLNERDLFRFDLITAEHVAPAVDAVLQRCQSALDDVLEAGSSMSYEQLSAKLDVPVEALSAAWGAVMHLQSVCDSAALRDAIKENQPKVTAFFSKLSSDLRVFELYKQVHDRELHGLSAPEVRRLENTIRGFRLSGAELNDEKKVRFIETLQRSAELSRRFSDNVMDATDAFAYFASAQELEGLPAEVMARLAAAARADGKDGLHKITLQQPSLIPVMQFASNRELRERLYRASVIRASEFDGGTHDNAPVISKIMALRHERAQLLGYPHHAAVSLVPKMADSAEHVLSFLFDLAGKSRVQAQGELACLTSFAREELGLSTLEPWDVGYASEQLRQRCYAFSEQEVKPYFQLERVLQGLFQLAEQLFDVEIAPEPLIGWHPSVTGYRIQRQGELVGQFYLDPFSRTGKRSGAWMSNSRTRWLRPDGSFRSSVAYIVTNFGEPPAGQPAQLSHGEVVTLFHEFGHALHALLTRVDTLGVSGVSGVEWDAIELPSQLQENFAWHWETLQSMSNHVDTGERLPRVLYDKMVAAKNFQVALGMLRQTEMAIFDMRIHAEPAQSDSIQAVLDQVREAVALVKPPSYNRFQNCFSHVFAGGYAAGYYSYLWADVLACDAWNEFERAGVLDAATGNRYRTAVLEVGGSRSMKDSFREFVGRDPSIAALLRQRGLHEAGAPA